MRSPGSALVLSTLVGLGVVVLAAVGCGDDTSPSGALPEVVDSLQQPHPATDDRLWPTALDDEHQTWTVQVVRRVPHDADAFTQGLELSDTGLVESTGRRGESTLRLLDPATGEVLRSQALDDALFGEGLTLVDDEVIQLTWTAGIALRWDAATFAPRGTHDYEGEGWGLCYDGASLWMSNGSARLTQRDPVTFEPVGEVEVRRDGAPVTDLNELECVEGRVLANVWKSDEIVVIDPASGTVQATIDAAPVVADVALDDADAVLNGIADLGDGTVLLGGKLWPRSFVVELVPAPAG